MPFATTGAVEMADTAKAIDAAFCKFFGIPHPETPGNSAAQNRPTNLMVNCIVIEVVEKSSVPQNQNVNLRYW
jgi:hypothetical protein